MKHAKALVAPAADYFGTAERDTFLFHASDGAAVKTVSGFDVTQDRVMLDFDHTYSDIMTIDSFHDGMVINSFGGGHVELHSVDYNHDGIMDTEIDAFGSGGDLHIVLFSVDVDSLHGWNLAGG